MPEVDAPIVAPTPGAALLLNSSLKVNQILLKESC